MKALISNKDLRLVWELSKKEFRLTYRNSFFGYIWSFFNPLFMLSTLFIIFTFIMELNEPNYQFFLLIGIICWNFFQEATTRTIIFLEANSALMKTHKINPVVLVLSPCISTTITLFSNSIIFFIMAVFFSLKIPIFGFASIFYLILLFLLAFGTSLVLAVVYSFFRDIEHIWKLGLIIGFWISPIVYSETIISEAARRIYMLNPLARIISHLRNIFIYNFPLEIVQSIITIMLVLLILFGGLYLMSKYDAGFGERF